MSVWIVAARAPANASASPATTTAAATRNVRDPSRPPVCRMAPLRIRVGTPAWVPVDHWFQTGIATTTRAASSGLDRSADRGPMVLRALRRRRGDKCIPHNAEHSFPRAFDDRHKAAELEPRELDASHRPDSHEAEVREEIRGEDR